MWIIIAIESQGTSRQANQKQSLLLQMVDSYNITNTNVAKATFIDRRGPELAVASATRHFFYCALGVGEE